MDDKKPLFGWHDELAIGITEVDEQHAKQIEMLNDIDRALHRRHGRVAAIALIVRLADFTREHFTFEESLMRVASYPDAKAHKKSHDELIKKVEESLDRLIKENAAITNEVLLFLKEWLIEHISYEDKAFGIYFQMANIKRNIPAGFSEETVKNNWWKFWQGQK